MKKNRKLLISILILFYFIFPIIQTSDDIFEIILNSKDEVTEVNLTKEDSSKIIYIKGDINKDKKYLMISLINNELNPSISISKNKDYDLTIPEYDYTLLSKENKLVLPSSYFNEDDLNGFYMIIFWDKEFKDLNLKFECLDEINLEKGEEFSFYARNENIDNFIIKVNDKSDKLKLRKLRSTIENIGFILSGGDENQLSMMVDKNKAKQMLNNIFAYWVEDVKDEYSINIKVSKNVKFFFKTQIFNVEEEIEAKNLEENLNNQYFLVKNNRQECFEFKFDDENQRDLIILSQLNFLININGEIEDNYEFKIQKNVKYAISDNLKLDKNKKSFCIQLNKEDSEDISLIQIYFYNKINNEDIIQEPLIPGIKYNYILSKKNAKSPTNQNINIHTHSQFFDKFSEQGEIIGINAIIKTISGKIKLYTDICGTFPKCSYNNNSRFKKEIYPIDGYFRTSIKANSDTYSTSKKQNLFIVVCEDENNDCKYEILFNNNQKKTFIKSLDTITKFLEPYANVNNSKLQDTYYTYLHSVKNKIVINLAVFSGDAYIVQINDVKGCKFDEEHFGSDERRIFHCDEDELDDAYDINNNVEIKIEFSIRAGKNGAIYSLFDMEQALDKNEIFLPIDISKFETVTNYKNHFRLLPTQKEVNKTITFINPINCNMNITNDNKNFFSYENYYIEYTNNFNNKSYFDLVLGKYNNYNNIDKCLFYFSSYSYSNEDSYLIITENKPLKFRLNNDLTNIKCQYLYAMTNGIKKIYLKVNVIGNNKIKIKLENINEENTNEYLVKDNKIITILNGNNKDIKGISLNNILKLKIYVELYQKTLKKGKEAFVELKIITDLNTPYFLKNGEQLSDLLINDEYKYYVALINKGSSGNYHINLNNNNNGNIYGRLLDSDHLKENGGWDNRFVLPTYNTDKNKLLPFDFENQKLIIEKEHTNFCNKFCYLLIGVKSNSINPNLDFTKTTITGFNSYLELNDNKEDATDDTKKFIKLTNNEYISSYVTDDECDFFNYKLNEHNSKLNMTFNCDNCIMTIVFNNTNFNSKDAKKYISNGDKKIINLGDNKTNIKNSTVYIKINSLNNETNSTKNKNNRDTKYRYSLKLNSPNDINDTINYIDGSMPETIEFNNNKNKYVDYAIKLDTYNSEEDINIIAVPNIDNEDNNIGMNKDLKNDIEIYATIINDDENITMDSWPTRDLHDFPPKGQNSSNFLKIKKKDIKRGENGKEDKIMLVRIYGKENDNINLHTNYEDIDNKAEEDLLIPGKYQLITVNNSNSNSSLKINVPSNLDKNKEYVYKIKKLDGNGKVTYGDETFELNDKYDSISIPLDKNIPSNKNIIDVKSININKNNTSNESFTFLIKYEEKNNNNDLEKVKIGGSKYFSSKDDTKPIESFIPLENINDDLPININFDDLHSSQEDEYKDQIRNNTETFDLEGFLITEEELNEIKNGNLSVIDKKKDYKYIGNYYIENRHGFLNINKNEIDRFKKDNKNSKPYLYFRMKKSKTNDKKYDNIKGNINVYPSNNTNMPIPEDDYNFNSIDCSKKNYHIYKLGDKSKNKNEGISDNTHNITIDFISPIEGLKVKIVKGLNETEEDDKYFGITKKENDNGKDTITISKNIDDAYLIVETPDKILNKTDGSNTNVDYMFKYSYEKKEKDKDDKNTPDIKFNNMVEYKKMGNTDLKTNLTLHKIKDSKKNKPIPCNYYIRIYKNNKKKRSQNNTNYYLKKNVSLINNNEDNDLYAIYKIDYNNPLLQNDTEDTFTVPIEIDTDEPVFFDVVAESVPDKKTYGYSKGYPNSDGDYDSNDDKGGKKEDDEKKDEDNHKGDDKKDKDGGGFSLIKFILIFICALLLLILLIVCCIKICTCPCLNSKSKDEQPATLLPGLRDITFHTTDDEGENNFSASSF